MALPATDDFAGTGALSASWSVGFAFGCARSAGVAVGQSGGSSSGAYWSADAFNADHYAQGVCVQGYSGPGVRLDSSGNGYIASGTTNDMAIYKVTGGSLTSLVSSGSIDPVSKTVKLTASGSALECFFNGVSQLSTTDGTYGSGAAGFAAFLGTSAKFDDFLGDNIGGAAFFPPFNKRLTQAVNRASTY